MDDVLFGGPADVDPDEPRRPSQMRVMVTVKAAPNPSASYGETVCVAGLRLDPGHEGWVRLYPINFRFIEQDHTFRKYDVVSLFASPASDGRRESWKPRIDSVHTETHLDGWPRRMPHLGPFAQDTMCQLFANSRGGRSLGLVKAREVSRLIVTSHPGWSPAEQQKIDGYVNQPELFDLGKPKSALEAPRFRATYHWRCPADGCRGHQQGLLDWEFTAFQRRLPQNDEAALAAIQRKWFQQICHPSRDVYFYVGNQAKRHQTFSILGIVYPLK